QMRQLIVPVSDYNNEKQLLAVMMNNYTAIGNTKLNYQSFGLEAVIGIFVGLFLCAVHPLLGVMTGAAIIVLGADARKKQAEKDKQKKLGEANAQIQMQRQKLGYYEHIIKTNNGADIPTRFRNKKAMSDMLHLMETGQALSRKEAYLLYAMKLEEEEKRQKEEQERLQQEEILRMENERLRREENQYSRGAYNSAPPKPDYVDDGGTGKKIASTIATGAAVAGVSIVTKALLKGIFKI
ncbi:MAG: hypothetical protein II714_03260, partial [Oscillospiraceae bacterium]|nr:hypothetical protein [Oscillospiraceae bacterium]